MRLNATLALRLAVVAVVSVLGANAFAGGLFDNCLFNGAVSTEYADDCSFFCENSLVIGDMECCDVSDACAYQSCATDGVYAECASCSGESEYVGNVGIPAAISYPATYSYPVASYVVPARQRAFRPVRNVLARGRNFLGRLRNFLVGGRYYDYCQPAYVCDPCWTVCDPCWTPCDACWTSCNTCWSCCDPCWTPCAPSCDPCAYARATVAPCAPACAPVSCCGNGTFPGELNELDTKTGLPKENNGPKVDRSKGLDAAQPLSTEPAVPAYDEPSTDRLDNFSEPADDLEGPVEDVPTPAADQKTAGVIRMLVPEDSVVYVNGYRTKQTGAVRAFAAKELERGETYSFEIRVVAERNGRVYEDVQTTTLTAGQTTALAFNLTLRKNEAVAFN